MSGRKITVEDLKVGVYYIFSIFLGYLLELYKIIIIQLSNEDCGKLFFFIQILFKKRPYISIEDKDSDSDLDEDSNEESLVDKSRKQLESSDDCGGKMEYDSSSNLINFIKRLDISSNNNCGNGMFFISSAFVFGNKGNKFFIEHVHNKLSLWCMLYSDLYINDIFRLLGKKKKDLFIEKCKNVYFFIIATDRFGKNYKTLINISKKINVLSNKPVMFSKITLQD